NPNAQPTPPPVTLTTIGANGNTVTVKGRADIQGNTVTFIPELRLHYDTTYKLEMSGLSSQSGDPLPPTTITFTTFKPVVLQAVSDVDARDVVWMNPNAWCDPGTTIGTSCSPPAGITACADRIAVAEGDAPSTNRFDDQGGVVLYDVSNLAAAPQPMSLTVNGEPAERLLTAGVDRALRFTPKESLTTKFKQTPLSPGTPGPHFDGPYLMSVD